MASEEEISGYIDAAGNIIGGIVSIWSPPVGAVVVGGSRVASKIYRDETKMARNQTDEPNKPDPLANEKDDAPIPSFDESGINYKLSLFRLANSVF